MNFKIKNEDKVYVQVFALHVLGWGNAVLLGRHVNPLFLVSVLLWILGIVLLCKDTVPEKRKEPLRRGFLFLEISNLVCVISILAAITIDAVFFAIIGGLLCEFLGFAGFVMIVNEVNRRIKVKKGPKSKNNSNKKRANVYERRCKKCGKKLTEQEKDYCDGCKYELEHTQCSVCGLYFQKDDLQVVEGAYYCQSCFMKKYANLGTYSEEENVEAKEIKKEQKACFSMIKDMFESDPNVKMSQKMGKEICGNPIFVIYTLATNQPLCYIDQLCAYDSYKKAEKALEDAMTNLIFKEYFYPQEIKPEDFAEEVKKYLCSGFSSMVVNNKYTVNLCDLPVYDENADYGSVCPMACNSIISYKERMLAFECDEAVQDRERSWQDLEKQKALFKGVVQSLGDSILLLPKEGQRKKLIGNKTLLIVFTDKFALKAYKEVDSATMTEVTMEDLYNIAETDESISGIIVNPGREAFKMKTMR